MANYLEVWDTLKSAITEAHSLLDLKSIRTQAEAYRYAAKLAGESQEVVRKAQEIKVRAERRAGELLARMPKQAPGDYRAKRYQADTVPPPSYKDLEVSKVEASKWQRIAGIPASDFEEWLVTTPDITTSGALQVAREFQRIRDTYARRESWLRNVSGRYSIILADPPWSYRDTASGENRWGGAAAHYDTLSTEELCDLRLQTGSASKSIAEIVEDDALLFLWATGPMLPDALKVIESWGFEYKTVAFTWVKRNQDGTPFLGLGSWTRSNAEYCLLGVRGNGLPRENNGVQSFVETARLGHSSKPNEVRERIVRLCGDVPRIELFAREQAEGWDCYGNEIDQDASAVSK
jgi:site-specific DNA-methyltransferase (adenine-specific)